MRAWLANLKRGTEHLNYGREVVAKMIAERAAAFPSGPVRILDVGLGTGEDLRLAREALEPAPVELYGLDSYGPNAEAAARSAIIFATTSRP